MYKEEQLKHMTVKDLLCVAKEVGVVGRHSMNKSQLISAILVSQLPDKKDFEHELAATAEKIEEWENGPKTQQIPRKVDYIERARVGQIIAFKVNNAKVISGKIEEIHKAHFVVITKNGIKFTVAKRDVIWVKTTDRWPKGVYLALKGEAGPDENKRPHYKSVSG